MEETKKYIIMCYCDGEDFYKIMDLSTKELMNWCEFFNSHRSHASWDSDDYCIWEFNEGSLKYAMIETEETEYDAEYVVEYEPEDLIEKYAY